MNLPDESVAALDIAAVIFDLDGVIVESEQVWERVRRSFVEQHGGTWRADSSRHMMGLSTREWADYLVNDLDVELPVEDVESSVLREMRRNYETGLDLVPGAALAVRRMAAHWRLAIASGSPRELIEVVLQGANLAGLFETTTSSDEVLAGKPAPDVYLEAARRLALPAAVCAVIEDSANGIRAARAAGMPVVAIPNRADPPSPEILLLADAVLPDIQRLDERLIRGLASG